MTNVANNYFRILSVLDSLNLKLTKTSKVGRPPKMSDLEVIALSFTAEYLSIDSENALFNFIEKELIDNLLERSQFNKRRRQLFDFSEQARQKLASVFLSFEDCFIIDSMPIEICKPARVKHLRICKEEQRTAPTKGYCASQQSGYYGYKLHGICSITGVFHSIEITQAHIHDLQILSEVSYKLSDCVLIGDKGYLSKAKQEELLQIANIDLQTPMRSNQKGSKKSWSFFKKVRKKIETLFSQLCNQFRIRTNYAKSFWGFKTRILAKITALTLIQYINKIIFDRNINKVKIAIT